MKVWLIILITLTFAGILSAQERQPVQTDDLAQSLQQWARDNLDDSVLQMLDQIDQDRVRDFFTKLQQRFEGTNIYELGTMKAVAVQVLPVLQEFEETRPYAIWLQTHLDELDVAIELQRQVKPTPAKPGATAVLSSPPLKLQRTVWVRELESRPWPPLAKNYVPQLKQIFTEEGVPPELVWLAEVESSFDSRARSPAGAAGMFQLMPETARAQNLSLWPWDERYQPQKSARAAARYLRYLHDHFGGWPLALAAYNAGESRVDRLLKRHNAHSFDAIARWLPAETQMYVPKLEATVRKREGVALAELKQ
ncbi:MAG TPA: lytic transglycosylase domain-containing protein [Verrucomicrobiae bacterium]|nr:lytic transglycosylase domain-containing protein [Verrucomicrobiae bacterium]